MLATLLVIPLCLILLWIWRKKHYWKHNNIPYLPSTPLIGNFKEYFRFKKSFPDVMVELYNSEKMKKFPFFGIHIFYKPVLLIKDRELIKRILVKDFNHFSDRLATADKKNDKVGYYNPFVMRMPEWKKMRQTMTHAFTSAKMKKSFSLVNAIGSEMNDLLLSEEKSTFTIEAHDICSRYTIDIVGSVGFGIQGNALKDPNSGLRESGRSIVAPNKLRAIEFGCCFFLSELVGFLRCKYLSRSTNKFLSDIIPKVVEEREKSGEIRNDFISHLISKKKEDKDKPEAGKGDFVFRGDVIVGQAGAYLIAGFETTSSTLSFGLFELAKNQEIQNRLKDEIKDMLFENDGEINYEAVQKMEYLHMVFSEISRMYPSVPHLDRICAHDYSLEPFSDFVIKKGTPVIIPSFAIQRDPNYFSNPNKFDPERFSVENKKNILPYTLLSFGVGPRSCVGKIFN